MMYGLDFPTLVNAGVIGTVAYAARTLLATSKGLAVLAQRQEDHEKLDAAVHARVEKLEDRLAS